jgi:RHS repeat-associated protein
MWPGQTPTAPSAASVSFAHAYNKANQRIGQSASDNSWLNYPPATPSTISYTTNALNQYTSVGTVTPSYDANGNLTSDGSFSFGYDAENRLTSAVGAGNTAAYTYDAQGRRKTKTVNGATTVFVTDAGNRGVLEYDGASGAIQRWYAYGLGTNDVLNQMNVVAATRTTLIPGIQGSVIASLDSASGTLSKIGYSPYGNSIGATPPFGYTGQRIDPETNGLYYYRARHYSPAWGRFLQTDPIGYAGGVNQYAYVGNDPLNLVDPLGVYGIVINGGGLIEAGIGAVFAQAGGQTSGGLAFLFDASHWSLSNPTNVNFSVVSFATAGGTASAFNSNPPSTPAGGTGFSQSIAQAGGGVIVGAFATAGVSFGFTNANTAADLRGLATTYSAGAGLGLDASGQYSQSDGGIYVAAVSPPVMSVGVGASASVYRRNRGKNVVYDSAS